MLRLTLFFTSGMSLVAWQRGGMLTREMALYNRLGAMDVKTALLTYGARNDGVMGQATGAVSVLSNTWGMATERYKRWLVWQHAWSLLRSDVFKSNQFDGADVALWAARRWRKPVVARCGFLQSEFVAREEGEESERAFQVRAREAWIVRHAAHVVVTTEGMKRTLCARHNVAGDRVTVIPNYVDTDLFRPSETRRSAGRRLCLVGRLEPQKNIEMLLDAMVGLDAALVVVGSGSLEGRLRRVAEERKLAVEFLGNRPHESLPGILRSCDAFVLPSRQEGHPKVLIEAMACGMPVVATDVEGSREEVTDGVTGMLCPEEPGALRASVERLLDDPALGARLGAAAREHALRHRSLERIADMEVRLLRRVVDEWRAARRGMR